MDALRYQQVKNILAAALESPADARAALLDAECGGDADLRAEVESLLAYEADSAFLVPGSAWAGVGSRPEPGEEEQTETRIPGIVPKAVPVLFVSVSRGGKMVWSGRFSQDATFGRSPGSDVVLDDSAVSWTHARAALGATGIAFIDLSKNGSFQAGQRIKEASLGRGGIISIPPFEIGISIENAPDAEAGVDASGLPPVKTPTLKVRPAGRSVATPVELRLIHAPADLLGVTFGVGNGAIVIGRSGDCDVPLDLASISRYHATLTPIDGTHWRLRDTNSQQGVSVNGRVVREADLTFGDRIAFGPDVVAILVSVANPE